MRKAFDLNRFTVGRPAFVTLANNEELIVVPAPLAAVGDYFGVAILKRGEQVVDHALFTRDGKLNTGLEMYMKGDKVKRWVNIYQNADGRYFFGARASDTREEARLGRDAQRAIDTVEVEFEVY